MGPVRKRSVIANVGKRRCHLRLHKAFRRARVNNEALAQICAENTTTNVGSCRWATHFVVWRLFGDFDPSAPGISSSRIIKRYRYFEFASEDRRGSPLTE